MKKTLGATALFLKDNYWKVIIIFFLALLVYMYTQTQSTIEEVYAQAQKYSSSANEYKDLRDNAQRQYEISIWKARCYDSLLSIDAEMIDCEARSNYEKFASYNEGK